MNSADLALLTGPQAHDLLATALATAGGELVEWSVRQVDHRPGTSTTTAYRARVRWGNSERTETLAATTGPVDVDSSPGVLALSDGARQVAVWRFPQDPGLPALAAASDPQQMADLLGSLGVPNVRAEDLHLRVRAYRPRRRAVIEVCAPSARVFVKVLRPHGVAELHGRHDVLYAAGLPVPRSLGWTPEGLLVLAPLAGTSMRTELCRAKAVLPAVAEFTAVLDRLPEVVLDLARRPSWSDGARHYAGVIGSALPEESDRATGLARAIEAGIAGIPHDEPTHGDLYEGQVRLESGRISGLLDVDTAGPGRRADDFACLLAHVEVLGQMYPVHAARMAALSDSWLGEMDHSVDSTELRVRVAGVLLSLATGPHRVQERGWQASTRARLDLVEHWLQVPVATRAARAR
ncbi:MAG: phosphotransferase [Candidatus Phosphoribacter sp.]